MVITIFTLHDTTTQLLLTTLNSWENTAAGVSSTASKPCTLRDIGRHLGLSHATVSLALRKDPRIKSSTQQRVENACRSLGYRPHPLLSHLMSQVRQKNVHRSQGNLALVDFVPKDGLQFHLFERGVRERAEMLGYHLDQFCLEPNLPMERLAQILQARGVRGVILSNPWSCFEVQPFEAFSLVTLGFRHPSPTLHFTMTDQYAAARTAHLQAREAGYQRIGFLADAGLEQLLDHRFMFGFASGYSQVPVPPDAIQQLHQDKPYEFREWLNRYRPDCIIVTYVPAIQDWLRQAGRRVPDDVALVTLDWQESRADLAGIRQHHSQVAASAVDLVISQINANESGIPSHPRGLLVEGKWVPGKSLPRRH